MIRMIRRSRSISICCTVKPAFAAPNETRDHEGAHAGEDETEREITHPPKHSPARRVSTSGGVAC